MFELIKFYINVRKDEKFLENTMIAALYTGDDEMIKLAKDSIKLLRKTKKDAKFNVKFAKLYNTTRKRLGF